MKHTYENMCMYGIIVLDMSDYAIINYYVINTGMNSIEVGLHNYVEFF